MSAALRLRSGLVIKIQELTPWYNYGSVGFKLWPASRVLISYLEGKESDNLPSTPVVELGSGSGACGLAASALGAPLVLFTDRPVNHVPREPVPFPCGAPGELMLDLIRNNIRLNTKVLGSSVAVKELTWGETDQIEACRQVFAARSTSAGLVIGSDVTYHSSGHAALFSTAASLLRPSESAEAPSSAPPCPPRFIFSHQHRGYNPEDTLNRLVDHAAEAGFHGPEKVMEHKETEDEIIAVYECTLKA
uniref:Calmodulin-lysine N-methyltransferase n=1 Tax=Rhizochromulina marina TaxID=1034831 RepID=A0A7S2SRL9_9STRA|mmetsp:Transcript_5483/g.16151  ORF Transcript_5483/g.16151 Transcript_5483/m.16151 type:complete len:248 (+) Transcript_5483:123-866(+)